MLSRTNGGRRGVDRSLHGGLWRWLQDRLAVGSPLRHGRAIPHHRSPRLEMLEERQLLSSILGDVPVVDIYTYWLTGFSCTPTESDGINKATFSVSLGLSPRAGEYPCSSPVTVHYQTTNGTAIAGEDYVAASGDLYFWPGETSKSIEVTILGDEVIEENETFSLTLTDASIQIGQRTGVAQIRNDDGQSLGEIRGTVFYDADSNGIRSPGEPGLPGVLLFLDDNDNGVRDGSEKVSVTATGNPNTPAVETGMYVFAGLEPTAPKHTPVRALPADFTQTFPATAYAPAILPDQLVAGLDFGFSAPRFRITAIDVADDVSIDTHADTINVHLNDTIRLNGFMPSDVVVDGVPATAAKVIDGNTIALTMSAGLAGGQHTLSVAVGAFLDAQGTPVDAFAGQFTVDATPPHVIECSLHEGDQLPRGPFSFTAQFDQPLRTETLDAADVELRGLVSGVHSPNEFAYDAATSTLSMTATDLPDDWYTLTLRSGFQGFENTLGFGLDAEVSTTFPWGDGVAGGDFVMHFAVDVDQGPLPPVRAETPLGSLVYRTSETGVVNQPGDADRFTVSVDRGQTMTVVLQTRAELQGQVVIRDSSGTIASATAANSGDTVVLQTIATSQTATENYTITVGGSQETYGGYTLGVFLNAAVETERYDGLAINDTAASAQDIDASFLHLGRGLAQRGAVLGSLPRGGSGEDWYRFTLADGQSTALTLAADPSHAAVLELYDGQGNLLATGGDVGGVNRIIGGFVDTTSEGANDAYFVRVSGTGVNYSLVVLRDAQFDAEPNDSVLPGVQDITRTGSVLGYVNWQSGQPEILEQKLTAEDAAVDDEFGRAVAISGDTAVVGSPGGGDGAVYVYHFEGADWQLQQKLIASDAESSDWFGRSVAICGDTMIVGSYSSPSGAAYVFHFDGDRWVEEQKLTASDAADNSEFGEAISIDGDTAVVGATRNGDGSAYVFHFNGSQWVEQQKLIASDGAKWDGFGLSTAICGDSIFVGAYCDDDNQRDSGSAYVFRFNGEQWTETQKLVASDPAVSGYFGRALAVSGDTAVIGEDAQNRAHVFRFDGNRWVPQQVLTTEGAVSYGTSVSVSGQTIVVGDPRGYGGKGSAYLYQFDGDRWGEICSVGASDGARVDAYGHSVAVSGDTALIGSPYNDARGTDAGAAYLLKGLPTIDRDLYSVYVTAGSPLVITTSTPGDGPGEFFNTLTPSLDLYDPAGNLVAADVGGAADGRNARIEYTAAASGLYVIRVATPEPAWLEYVLDVTGYGGDLGPVDYLELPGMGARPDGSAFALETTHDGILTLTATPSSPGGAVGLALYDQDPPAGEGTAPVATSTLVDGRQRIDYEVRAGQTYYFRITGDGSLANLIVANVFNRQGDRIEVHGSGGSDRFEFCATAPRALKINDLLYKFLQGEVGSISFDGGAGDDSAVLLGGPRDETVTLRPGEGTLVGNGYRVSVANTANIAARGMGGHDTATFYDSPGQDNFVATPAYASLKGDGYCNQAWQFAEVRAYATAGGIDEAKLYDSPGNDAYVGTPTYNMLGGQGFHNEAWYFDRAQAVAAAGGIDEAKFYDSPGDDLYSAGPDSAWLMNAAYRDAHMEAGISSQAVSFEGVHAYATAGGHDVANFVDSPGNDRFVATPCYGAVFNPDYHGTYSTGFYNRAKFFEEVNADATAGGVDIAWLYDSPGDDAFYAEPAYAALSNPDYPGQYSKGYTDRASYFEAVHAMATAGGHDRADLHDSPVGDTFYADPTEASLYNSTHLVSVPSIGQLHVGFYNRAKFFEEVRGHSTAGGRDTARLYGSDQDDVFTADPTKAVLANATYQVSYTHGFSNEASSFERVYASAGEGNDAATLLDAANEVDLLTAQGISARLSCQALDLIYEAAGFDRVQATSRTSGDKKSLSKTDPPQFLLNLEGLWQNLA